MTKTKHTKRALIVSALSLLLCVSMLVGSTFAWFTDNASTEVNKIQAGTLKIELLDKNNNDLDGKTLGFVKANGDAITDSDSILWEPGCRYLLQPVTLKNTGNLWLKYKMVITAANGATTSASGANLADVIDVYIGEKYEGTLSSLIAKDAGVNDGILEPGKTAAYDAQIKLVMKTDAGNAYQGLSLEDVAVTVYATQYTKETDSYDDQYDAGAQYQMPLADSQKMVDLFTQAATATQDVVIDFDQDYDGRGWTGILPQGYNGVKNVTINGNGHTIYNLEAPLMIGAFAGWGGVTIKDLNIVDADISRAYDNGLGVGAFLSYSDASGSVTLENCKAVNCKISATGSGSGAAALVGYTSCPSLTMKNCSVSGCTINGKGASALIGFTQSNATISGCTVVGNTMTGSYAAVVCGTVTGGSNTMAITNLTHDDNSTTGIYGRKFVTVTLDGKEI